MRRTVRTVRRVSTLASMLPLLGWLVVPLLLLVIVLVGSRTGTDDATGSLAATTPAATPQASTPAAATSASATPTPSPSPSGQGAVRLEITLEDVNGAASSVAAVVLLGDRALVPTTVRLPLTLTATGRPGDRLSIVVPQPPAGSHLVCTIAASGAVTGAMTREQTDGMLDCTSSLADIATGGT